MEIKYNNSLFLVGRSDNPPYDTLHQFKKKIPVLEIPFLKFNDKNYNFISYIKNNNKKKKLLKKKFNKFINFQYIYFSYKSLSKFLKKKKIEYIFTENLNCFLISFLYKLFNKDKFKIIFSDGDIIFNNFFFKRNLTNIIKNFLFYFILLNLKRIALSYSNFIFCSSKRLIHWNKINVLKNYKFIFLPRVYNYKKCRLFSRRKYTNNYLYIGNMSKKNGLDNIIEIASCLSKFKKNFTFHLVGGEHQQITYYKKKVAEYGLRNNFKFYGYLENGKKFKSIIKKTCVALAPYLETYNGKSYVNNGKMTDYLNFCLPIITTNYPLISNIIKVNKFGIVTNSKYKAVKYLLSIKKKYASTQKNILNYTKKFNYPVYYEKLFLNISK